MKDLYKILGCSPSATKAQLKACYRHEATRLHPDRQSGSTTQATEDMAALNEAYETLAHPERRARYDRDRAADLALRRTNRIDRRALRLLRSFLTSPTQIRGLALVLFVAVLGVAYWTFQHSGDSPTNQNQTKPEEVYNRDDYTCVYCGREMLEDFDDWMSREIGHLIPILHGGSGTLANQVTSCNVCNRLKGTYTPKNHEAMTREQILEDVRTTVQARRQDLKHRRHEPAIRKRRAQKTPR